MIKKFLIICLFFSILLVTGCNNKKCDICKNVCSCDKTYNVKFVDSDGTILKEENVIANNSAIAPLDPTKEGHVFTGWSKNFTNVQSDMIIVAQYTVCGVNCLCNKTFLVTFVDSDGTILKTEKVNHYDSATAPKNPTKEGHKFVGWGTDFTNVQSNLIVVAQYTKNDNICTCNNDYIVVFVDNDGTVLKTEKVNENESATPPTPPTKVGYTFIEWNQDFTNVKNNLVVVAQYEKNTTNDNINNNQLVYAGKGYGLTHKDYVGIAEIKVLNDIVIDLKFEEVYFPTHWAGLITTEGISEDLYVTYTTSKGKEACVAKYIVVDRKLFTGAVIGTDVKYSSSDIEDLKVACKDNEEIAKWYAEALLAGNAYAVNADGSLARFQIVADKEGGFTKSTTGYWSGDNYPLGWKGNMEALAEAMIGTSMGFTDANLVKNAYTKYWEFGANVSRATLTDGKDYVAIAQKAYDNALKTKIN